MTTASKPRRSRRWLWLVLAALAVVFVLGAYRRVKRRQAQVEVRTAHVEKRTVIGQVTAQGTLAALEQVDVTSEVSGRVAEVYVTVGQMVEPGDALFAIEDTQARNGRDQLRAAVRAAEAMQKRAKLALAELERQVRRDEDLAERGLLPKEQLSALQARLALAQTDVVQSKASLDRARIDMRRAKDALDKTRVLSPAKGVVVDIGVDVGQVVSGLASNVGSSDMLGLGGGAPRSPAVVVADLSRLLAKVKVDELDIARVKPGQNVDVELEGLPGTSFSARITEVGLLGRKENGAVHFAVEATLKDSPLGKLVARAPSAAQGEAAAQHAAEARGEATPATEQPRPDASPAAQLRPGMSLTAHIEVERLPDALAVPVAAVLEGRPGATGESAGDRVFVVDRTAKVPEAKARTVVLGPSQGQVIAVTSGLSANEEVVAGPYRALRDLKDGTPLREEKDADDVADGAAETGNGSTGSQGTP